MKLPTKFRAIRREDTDSLDSMIMGDALGTHLDQLLSKFSNGTELYWTDSTFHYVINSILHGADPYKIIKE